MGRPVRRWGERHDNAGNEMDETDGPAGAGP
jgi:hypothetical protein